MNIAQTILLIIWVVLLTSVWWAVGMFGAMIGNFRLIVVALLSSIVTIIILIDWFFRLFNNKP